MFIKVQEKLINLDLVTAIETSKVTTDYDHEVEKGRDNIVIAHRLSFTFNHKTVQNFVFFNEEQFDLEFERLQKYLANDEDLFILKDISDRNLSDQETTNKYDFKSLYGHNY